MASESVKGSLLFSFGFPKPETVEIDFRGKCIDLWSDDKLKSGLGHSLRFSVSIQLY